MISVVRNIRKPNFLFILFCVLYRDLDLRILDFNGFSLFVACIKLVKYLLGIDSLKYCQ